MTDTNQNEKPVLHPMRSKGLLITGAVLLALGVAQVVLSMVGSGREGLGTLFFHSDQVNTWLADAKHTSAPFRQVCRDPRTAAAFDDSSVKDLLTWCAAAEKLAEDHEPEAAVAMLRAQNRYFGKLTEYMLNRGGDAGELAGTLMEASCQVRPPLEDIFSETSGAAFSQALLGFLLAGVGYWMVSHGRKRVRA